MSAIVPDYGNFGIGVGIVPEYNNAPITAGLGIDISNYLISNKGVIDISAGSGITISGSKDTSLVINATSSTLDISAGSNIVVTDVGGATVIDLSSTVTVSGTISAGSLQCLTGTVSAQGLNITTGGTIYGNLQTGSLTNNGLLQNNSDLNITGAIRGNQFDLSSGVLKLGTLSTPSTILTLLPAGGTSTFTLINAGVGGYNTGVINSGGWSKLMANAFQFQNYSFSNGNPLSQYNLLRIRLYGNQPLYGVANQAFSFAYSGGTGGVFIPYIVDTGNLSVNMPCYCYFQTLGWGSSGGQITYPEIQGKDMTFFMSPRANSGFHLLFGFEQGAGGIIDTTVNYCNLYADITAII